MRDKLLLWTSIFFLSLVVVACDDDKDESTEQAVPDTQKYVFVSSSTHTGSLGGLSGADAICNQLASNAGLPGTYKAWLGDSTDGPATRFTQSSVPYVRTDENQIASNWADLIDASLDQPINLDENGNAAPSSSGFASDCSISTAVWSAASLNGTSYGNFCNNFTSTTGSAYVGDYSVTFSNWSDSCVVPTAACANTAPIYCFQQ